MESWSWVDLCEIFSSFFHNWNGFVTSTFLYWKVMFSGAKIISSLKGMFHSKKAALTHSQNISQLSAPIINFSVQILFFWTLFFLSKHFLFFSPFYTKKKTMSFITRIYFKRLFVFCYQIAFENAFLFVFLFLKICFI